jgi:hypothetical protein
MKLFFFLFLFTGLTHASTCIDLEVYPEHTDLPDRLCFDAKDKKMTGALYLQNTLIEKLEGETFIHPAVNSYNRHTGDPIRGKEYLAGYLRGKSFNIDIDYIDRVDSVKARVNLIDQRYRSVLFTIQSCPGKYYTRSYFCKYED